MIVFIAQVVALAPVVTPPAPSAPPRVIQTVVAPPPIVQVPYTRSGPRFMVDVRITADGTILFEGPLRIAIGSTATVRREQSEPAEVACPAAPWSANQTNALELRLMPAYAGADSTGTSVVTTVRWTRPAPTKCGERQGSRQVELTETVALAPGATATVDGDAGLRVTIRRR